VNKLPTGWAGEYGVWYGVGDKICGTDGFGNNS